MSPRPAATAHRFGRTTSLLPERFGPRTPASHAEVAAACPRRRALVSRDVGQRRAAAFLEESNRLLAAHAGEDVEEDLEAVAALDVVQQRANGYARADEDRIAAVNIRIGMDDRLDVWHTVPRWKDTTPVG